MHTDAVDAMSATKMLVSHLMWMKPVSNAEVANPGST